MAVAHVSELLSFATQSGNMFMIDGIVNVQTMVAAAKQQCTGGVLPISSGSNCRIKVCVSTVLYNIIALILGCYGMHNNEYVSACIQYEYLQGWCCIISLLCTV